MSLHIKPYEIANTWRRSTTPKYVPEMSTSPTWTPRRKLAKISSRTPQKNQVDSCSQGLENPSSIAVIPTKMKENSNGKVGEVHHKS
jgi:hypothetical protein